MKRLLLSLLVLPLLGFDAPPRTAAERLQADVARLAGDEWEGRRAGTRGGDHAADWIASEMHKIGLEAGGEQGTYYQGFSFIDGVDLGPGNRLAVGGRAFAAGTEFRPLAFSSAGTYTGPAAFAGYGIVSKELDHDDYAGLEVKDRLVLVLRHGPGGDDPQSKWAPFAALRQKASVARDKGARALLIVTGPETPHAPDELVPLRADASFADAGIPVVSVTRAVAEALFAGAGTTLGEAQKKLDQTGKPAPLDLPASRVELVTDVTPHRATTRNVLGFLRAPGDGAEVIVVGAHYDHLGVGVAGMASTLEPEPAGKIHHGADDNASGVAGLLELARRFAPRRAALKRSLLFVAFGAEELGTLGSSHFVKEPTVPWRLVAAMVNMDMIGRLRDDALQLSGTGTSPVWGPLLEEANRGPGLKLKLQEGGYGPSDHSPFYAADKPVLFAFTGAHSQYHRASDTAELINAAGLDRVVGFLESVVSGLVEAATPVAFTRVAAEKEQGAGGARGFRVWVGGVPDYGQEGPGVRFSGVSPGSPAERGGIQDGDVLVRFGPKEIRNIYDYTYALGEHQPGDRVSVVVKRDGKDVTLELTLSARPGSTR
ncbi:MAG TPA: M20/M25/M40 family metallo-hydrolase [Vicinamibacteria bacterium]